MVDVQDVSEHRTLVNSGTGCAADGSVVRDAGDYVPSVAANQNDVGGSQGEKGTFWRPTAAMDLT